MRKPSKGIMFLLATGGFLILLSVFGFGYWKEAQAQQELSSQIAASELTAAKIPINDLTLQQTNLKANIVEAGKHITTSKTSLTRAISGGDASRLLYGVAAQTGVEIVSITSTGTGSQTVERVSLSSLGISVKAQGSLQDVVQFILDMGRSFPTGVIKSVTLEMGADSTSGKTLATLTLNIYSYKDE